MAQEKLIVKNFGPIKDAEIELGKVTVFIGEQASGKSVLAKLVAIMRNIQLLLSSNEKKAGFFEDFNINVFFSKDSFLFYENNLYSIAFENETFRIKEKESFKSDYALLLKEESVTISEMIKGYFNLIEKFNKIKNQETEGKPDIEKFTEDFAKTLVSTIRGRIPQAIYIPAERLLLPIISNAILGLLSNEVNLPKFLTQFGRYYEIARKQFSSKPFLWNNLSYEIIDNEEFVTFNKAKIRLIQASSGLQSIIPLLIVVDFYYENSKALSKTFDSPLNTPFPLTFVVEEPELNLYPTNQRMLINYLVEKCLYDDHHLIITTHSPYILSSLDNLIQAGNVIKKHPELKEEVEKIIPAKYHLNYEDVKVYFVADGTARLIMNEEYQSIDVSELDEVSEGLNADFEKLLDLKYQD